MLTLSTPPHNTTTYVTPVTTPSKHDITPPSSAYSSTHTTPVKRQHDPDGDSTIFHSCQAKIINTEIENLHIIVPKNQV